MQYNQLTSPGYPNNYPDNMDCNYWIYIPNGNALRIYFDLFEMDDCGLVLKYERFTLSMMQLLHYAGYYFLAFNFHY